MAGPIRRFGFAFQTIAGVIINYLLKIVAIIALGQLLILFRYVGLWSG